MPDDSPLTKADFAIGIIAPEHRPKEYFDERLAALEERMTNVEKRMIEKRI